MKTFKTSLAVITAVLLGTALLASPSVAATGTPDAGSPSGALYQREPGTTTKIESPFPAGKEVQLYANFANGVRNVTFYEELTADTWTVIGTDEANSSGNAYYPYTIREGTTRIFAEDANGLETEIDPIVGTPAPPPPPPGTASLAADGTDGKKFIATFNPATNGATTSLQVREICTYETNETNPETGPFDKDVSQKDCKGPWKTRATSKQNSSGQTTFTISDPLEVEHTYRAVSGSTNSEEIKFAAPLPTDPYGIDTGLSELHFNSYEGDSVNTRTRYFEGAFSMTASEKGASPTGTPCAEAKDGSKTAIMKSTMKGRGNYSWSFPKKSFTLKIGKSTDLCGLGASKKYALVANDYDKSLLRNTLATYVGSNFNKMGWTPKAVPVDFYMNGSYRGSYLLIERIAIAPSRVNIDELKADGQTTNEPPGDANNSEPNVSGGYIMEWDFRKGADYNVSLGSDSGYVGIKEPENDYDRSNNKTTAGISSQQKSYISKYLNDADNALRGSNFTSNSSGWQKYIDIDSAVDYYLAMEFMKPVDGSMWASVFMYKPRGEKIHFGPMWDFDLAAGSANRAGNVVSSSGWYLRNNLGISAQQSSKTWFHRLNEDPEFRDAVKARWNTVEGGMNVSQYMTAQSSLIEDSATANFKKWPYKSSISKYQVKKGSWSKDVSYVKSWATGRKSWINGQL